MTKALNIRLTLLSLSAIMVLLPSIGFSQKMKPFTGMLEYTISAKDSALQQSMPNNSMIMYTNDTITRIENNTGSLGKQATIRHIEKNKSYLLLSTPLGDFAIKTDLNAADTSKRVSKYSFKKKWGRKKVMGMRAKRMIVTHEDYEEPMEFLYLKKYSKEYLNNFEEVPGLLVKYSVVTPDGILNYELIKFNKYTPNRDLFGVPASYKKVTFDEFLDNVLDKGEPIIEEN